jgi:hypothetical protein
MTMTAPVFIKDLWYFDPHGILTPGSIFIWYIDPGEILIHLFIEVENIFHWERLE